jgi:hypothetical protein
VAPPIAEAEPLGFAGTLLPRAPSFARIAYAFGQALDEIFRAAPAARRGGPARRHSPTFQIPVAVGDRDDPDRLRRRFVVGLTSVRMRDGAFEPFEAFRARLGAQIAREARAEGLLSRLLRATAAAPVPDPLRRRMLGSSKSPSRWVPPVEILGGRAQLSSLRFVDGEAPAPPLYAASTPSLPASPDDPRGSFVLTLVHHGAGAVTASVAGTGLAGSEDGAAAILETVTRCIARCT